MARGCNSVRAACEAGAMIAGVDIAEGCMYSTLESKEVTIGHSQLLSLKCR